MGWRLWNSLAIVALVAAALDSGRAQDSNQTLTVPAKEVPLPANVSPELREFVDRPVPPLAQMPTTPEGWKQLQREADGRAAELARSAAKSLKVKVAPTRVGGVACFDVTPAEIAPGNEKRLIIHVHGGAYTFNAGEAATGEAVLLAHACKTRVLSIDYRVPPDHPFPAASDDVLAVWAAAAANHDPKKTAMGGTSAGAGLTMTTMLRLKERNLPAPAAIFLGTPGADLSKTGDSMYLNAEVDNALGRYEGRAQACITMYANGRDLKDPLISPLYGDLSVFPPTILITGTRDLLLSPTASTHRKLRAAGVVAELHVFEGMSHGMYLASFPGPESQEALREIAAFFDRQLQR